MADAVELELERRQGRGTRAAEKLRAKGFIPGILYGHKEETISVSVSAEALADAIRHRVSVVDLKFDGLTQKAQISEVQWDHLGKDLLHVDFKRVSADERIEVTVRIELKGLAPGVTAGGGLLDQPLHELTVECLAVAVPESIRVPLGELQVGQAIHVRDLKLPEGVKALADPDLVVVHVTPPKGEEEVAAPAEQAEPEVIGRREEEEGEEEKK
jgi:large subunit ribosomal protein L25